MSTGWVSSDNVHRMPTPGQVLGTETAKTQSLFPRTSQFTGKLIQTISTPLSGSSIGQRVTAQSWVGWGAR